MKGAVYSPLKAIVKPYLVKFKYYIRNKIFCCKNSCVFFIPSIESDACSFALNKCVKIVTVC